MKDRRSTHAGSPTRYVPPSGFGYPPDGLLPSIPCRFSFAPAALLGFTLRSVPLSKGIRGCYHPDGPTYRFAHRCSRRRSDGPAQRAAVPGLHPFESPLLPDRGLVSRQPDAPLGFAPSRVHHRRPRSRFRPNTSLALCLPNDESSGTPAPQSICQPSTGSIRHATASCSRRTEQPS
jgi:hypothetical protein